MPPFTNIKALIIDMDGVLWRGDQPITGLNDFFDTLRKINIPFILATNNASLTPTQYTEKFARMGVTIKLKEILTSAMATALHLSKQYTPKTTRVFVIGEQGIKEPLLEKGFTLTGLNEINDGNGIHSKTGPHIVICGLDRKISWEKMSTATLNINAGAAFFGTNGDTSFPMELGETLGNGAILAALTAATHVTPTIIGKPEPIIYQQAMAILKSKPEETIAIGDRLDTDILGAIKSDIRSLMVLTGVSNHKDVAESPFKPTWVMDSISSITLALTDSQPNIPTKINN